MSSRTIFALRPVGDQVLYELPLEVAALERLRVEQTSRTKC